MRAAIVVIPVLLAASLIAPALAYSDHDDAGYAGEIRLYARYMCPVGWVEARGQEVGSNFELAGVIDDGFVRGNAMVLPDLRNAAPVSANGGRLKYCINLGKAIQPSASPTPPPRRLVR